jgi:sulfatase maturation enzyme AslB (radical SAM superfamily)
MVRLSIHAHDCEISATEHQEFLKWLNSREYVQYPVVVSFETLALCNAGCEFCPYPSMPRQGERMPDALIEKIVDDLTAIPESLWFEVNPSRINEPFLDTRLVSVLEMVNSRLPRASVRLISNASAFTADNLTRLARVRNVSRLNVSLNEFRADEYERVMKIPFNRTVACLDELHRLKINQTITFPVVLSRVGDGSPADTGFRAWTAERYPAFETDILIRGDFLGAVPIDNAVRADVPDVGCSQWFKLHVLADGRVPVCCQDANGELSYGNVATEHLLDIYNRPSRRRLREMLMSRQQLPECAACALLV